MLIFRSQRNLKESTITIKIVEVGIPR
uniref:Uncharacterized protein n=1 Tax=Arundo donax TaxID=35708 RepID=A0A0A8YQA6_ARUDO